ncbi:TIGR00300 family protein [Syntrophotalea acetylenivorans]|uniref:ornithine cyclodeaminase n=1 Tax=Syntrophotalea acetylenivorans TaxID=1842532 RepID=A0A1L3GSK1_9BACT|nr:TIGR00300 family protein [Syntrophotalea acetylenivorans]APG28902.1 TIGR00300 family protein [Syntrophotalea acetylenivorans]
MEQQVVLRGHLIDDQILSRVLDAIGSLGAEHEIEKLSVGRTRQDCSEVLLRITAPTSEVLAEVLERIAVLGAEPVEFLPARLQPAPGDGVLPKHFYATTNLPTKVLVAGHWLSVTEEEMDLALVVSPELDRVRALPMTAVKAGDQVVVGEQGVRVSYPPRVSGEHSFRFMSSSVSAEKPKSPLLQQVVAAVRRIKQANKKVLLVGGPAIVHTGAGPLLEELIRQGWVDVLFAGNALAAHDIEQALFGTSLGVPVCGDRPSRSGHAHHLWAINSIREAGSIKGAVTSGVLNRGIMHACVTHQIPFVLAGSIRDDGPLPEVVTDVLVAQEAMRQQLSGVGLAFMIGTTLHAIATGNLLPARVFTVCVDINPGVVTKLHDRGSRQSLGIVMDAASFLEQLARGLEVEISNE